MNPMKALVDPKFIEAFRPKLIWLLAANILVWIAILTLYKMPPSFGILFSSFTLPFLVYFFLSDLADAAGKNASGALGGAVIYYLLAPGGLLAAALWIVTRTIGFPRMFSLTIIAYALLCLFLFIYLEFKRPMREPQGFAAVNNIIIVYFVSSAMFIFMSWSLPQYNPEIEIARLTQKGLSLEGADKETVVKAGKQVFKDFECFNCHNASPGGEPKRGPNLAEINVGNKEKIKESLVDPYKEVLKPFADNPKVARSMPDYYQKQMSKDELEAIITYIENIKTSGPAASSEAMPNGWWVDPAVVAEGKNIFEGITNPDVGCHACHGKDGAPIFEGAADFRKDQNLTLFTDARWFQIVKFGFKKDSPMAGWAAYLSDEQIWKVIAYIWTFYSKETLRKEELVERPAPPADKAIQPVKEKYWD
jgi:mono/diheme cytochrome c family protein